MTKLEVFQKLLDLLKDPARWTQGKIAADSDGYNVNANSDNAIKWCLYGGLNKILGYGLDKYYNLEKEEELNSYIDLIHEHLPRGYTIPTFNDQHNHEDIVKLIQDIINSLQERDSCSMTN